MTHMDFFVSSVLAAVGLVVGGVVPAEAQVLGYRAGEQDGALLREAHAGA